MAKACTGTVTQTANTGTVSRTVNTGTVTQAAKPAGAIAAVLTTGTVAAVVAATGTVIWRCEDVIVPPIPELFGWKTEAGFAWLLEAD